MGGAAGGPGEGRKEEAVGRRPSRRGREACGGTPGCGTEWREAGPRGPRGGKDGPQQGKGPAGGMQDARAGEHLQPGGGLRHEGGGLRRKDAVIYV